MYPYVALLFEKAPCFNDARERTCGRTWSMVCICNMYVYVYTYMCMYMCMYVYMYMYMCT